MKAIHIIFFALLSISGWAQPVLTSSWVPSAGQQFTLVSFNPHLHLDAGSGGDSMTWDLSAIDTAGGQTSVSAYINPATASQTLQFPGATDCSDGGNGSDFDFNKLADSVYQMLGEYLPNAGQPWLIEYTDLKDLFHFPVGYQSFFADTARFSLYVGGAVPDTQFAALVDSVLVDGYGTLITRAGTFDHVLRIHYIVHQVDTDYSLAMTSTIYSSTYIWVSPSYPGITLASISHDSGSVGQPADFGYYSFISSSGIEPLSADRPSSWSITPQPASDHVRLVFQNTIGHSLAHLSIRDITGQLVGASDYTLSADQNEIDFSVANFPEGAYTATLQLEGTTNAKKFIVRH